MSLNIIAQRHEEQENKLKLSLLYRIASFLSSKRFIGMYKAEDIRFKAGPADIEGVFYKIRHNLLFQLAQSARYEITRDFRENTGRPFHDMPIDLASKTVSEDMIVLAKQLELYVGKINSREKVFKVARSECVRSQVYCLLDYEQVNSLSIWLEQFSSPGSSVRTFEVRNALVELAKWSKSLDTLSNRTPLSGYELMLDILFRREGYFAASVEGYPYDLLCHDRVSIERVGEDIQWIAVHKEYPSSIILPEGSSVPEKHQFFSVGKSLVAA